MDNIVETNSLLPWIGIAVFLVLGAIFLAVVAWVGRSVGTEAAIQRLRKWTRLPNAVLGLLSAPNTKVAVRALTSTLAEALNVAGALTLLAEVTESGHVQSHELLIANGTLQGRSDANMIDAVLSVEPFNRHLHPAEGLDPITILSAEQVPFYVREEFPLMHKNALMCLGLRLHGRNPVDGDAACLILFDLGRQKALDRFEVEAVQATVAQFPSVVEGLTGRFAQAELSEQLVETTRKRDEILEQMLSGFQHDVANALRNLEQGVATAKTTLEAQTGYSGLENPEAIFAELSSAIELAGQVAYSASMLPEMAKGDVPLVDARPHDPALLFSRLLQPLISLKANSHSHLVVNYEVEANLPQIEVDQVAFFRAMSNIIGNAFKFTETGGINILVYGQGGLVAFSVSDTGIGIPSEEIGRIGEMRFRSSNAVDIAGTGLGLWTTIRLVESMAGSLEIDSKLGRGSTVTLKFPVVEQWS